MRTYVGPYVSVASLIASTARRPAPVNNEAKGRAPVAPGAAAAAATTSGVVDAAGAKFIFTSSF